MVDLPALPASAHIDPWTAIAPLALGDFSDSCALRGILLTPTTIPERVPIERE